MLCIDRHRAAVLPTAMKNTIPHVLLVDAQRVAMQSNEMASTSLVTSQGLGTNVVLWIEFLCLLEKPQAAFMRVKGGMFPRRAPGACPARPLCIKHPGSGPKVSLMYGTPPSRPHWTANLPSCGHNCCITPAFLGVPNRRARNLKGLQHPWFLRGKLWVRGGGNCSKTDARRHPECALCTPSALILPQDQRPCGSRGK